jgi:hypothetical protein
MEKPQRPNKGVIMVLASKPPLNLLAGWQFLLDRRFRQEVKEDWQTSPAWVVAVQMTVGACSVLFPLIVVGLLAFVFITRHI